MRIEPADDILCRVRYQGAGHVMCRTVADMSRVDVRFDGAGMRGVSINAGADMGNFLVRADGYAMKGWALQAVPRQIWTQLWHFATVLGHAYICTLARHPEVGSSSHFPLYPRWHLADPARKCLVFSTTPTVHRPNR